MARIARAINSINSSSPSFLVKSLAVVEHVRMYHIYWNNILTRITAITTLALLLNPANITSSSFERFVKFSLLKNMLVQTPIYLHVL